MLLFFSFLFHQSFKFLWELDDEKLEKNICFRHHYWRSNKGTNSVFSSQISSFHFQLITNRHNRAQELSSISKHVSQYSVYDNPSEHRLVRQILGKHVKWGLSKQYCGYRERLGRCGGSKCGIQSISGREAPIRGTAVIC